jgi:non-specific serine/threonine protein kinase/serine/threonine-protein kinase
VRFGSSSRQPKSGEVTPERWQQVKRTLDEAIALDLAHRSPYLDRIGATDPELRSEVETLLHHHLQAASGFLVQPAVDGRSLSAQANTIRACIGSRVGVYELVEEIGQGGMGSVYRAARADGQYEKQVAVKLVRSGYDTSSVLERFRQERQILASLDHPNIARLLDGGTTDDGIPYLVMELIEGIPVDEYCNQNALPINRRLEIFRQVCGAVQFAHQRLVIHRDIKPGNILVTSAGTPKLLDFGIAKIFDPTSASQATMLHPLTPEYASPEQIRGEPITTATDVYSLGVVLYRLLTGQSPYRIETRSPAELARAITETEPLRPSMLVGEGVGTEQFASDGREASAEKLRRRLLGDLDNIVLMALRKESQRRYSSVEQFAEDVRRHLEGLPVVARKGSWSYGAGKFVKRNKVAVAAVGVVVLAIAGGVVATVYQARIAQANALRAERRFHDVRSLANSLIFDVHDSIKDLPGATPARKVIVDRALQYLNVLAQESAGDVGLERELATAYEKVGTVQGDYLQNNLGDTEGALASYKRALAIRQRIDVQTADWNDHLALAQSYRLVAHQLWATGDLQAAREHIDQAIAISEPLNAARPGNPKLLYEVAFDHEVSGEVGYSGDPLESKKLMEDYDKALAADESTLKIQPDDVRTLHGYAVDLRNTGDLLESSDPRSALRYYERALEINRKLTQRSTEIQYARSVAISYGEIADAYADLGDYAREAENNRKGLEIYQNLSREDPKNALLRQGLAIAYVNTATAVMKIGNTKESLGYSGKGLEIMRSLVESAPPNAVQKRIYAAMLAARGTILIGAGKPNAAISDLDSARSIYESLDKAGSEDQQTNVAACEVGLGKAATQAGYDAQAADYFARALTIVKPLVASKSADLNALYAAADAYSGLGELSRKKAERSHQSGARGKSNWTEARSWYEQSLSTWRRIEHPNRTSPNGFQVGDPASVAKKLKATEAALASLHPPS